MKKRLIGFGLTLVALAAIGFSYKNASDSKQGIYTIGVSDRETFYESTYQSYLEANGYQGKMATGEVAVDLSQYSVSENAVATLEPNGISTSEQGKVTWQFEVDTPGFYNLEIGYVPLEGTNSSVERKLYLDGESFFKGMEQISFDRSWVNESDEIEVRRNDEVRPNTIEKVGEQVVFIEDSQKRVAEPYKFYLSKGTHTLTLEAVKEPMCVTGITFKEAPELISYDEKIEQLKEEYPVYGGSLLIGQAERVDGMTTNVVKSSRSILMNSNYSSPRLQPAHAYNIVFNTIGGDSWKTPGDAVTWEIEVPEKGLYQLSFTARQNINRGSVSYRRLKVNGEVPFKEANSIGFPYSTEFVNYIIGDENGAYLIPLEQGKNTITFETVLGEFDRAATEVEECLFIMNETYRKIIQLTGTVPDQYIDYEIDKKLPEVKQVFEQEAVRLNSLLEDVIAVTGEKGEEAVILEKLAYQLTNLAKDPNKVVKEIEQLKNNISSLGLWNMDIASMPLEVDTITLSKENDELIQTIPGFFEKFMHETKRFAATFFGDNTSFSDEAGKDERSVKVWIGTGAVAGATTGSGRDQAQVLMNLVEEAFTPRTGINVQLELIPDSVIIPATLAGEGPDVVIGLPDTQAMNFAVRNALVDLSQFEDFEEIASRYYPSAFESITYQDGVYGLPEQQTFMMMFYRNDILEELGLEPPKTWEEVKDMIPILQANNYDFYMPSTGLYPSLVYQAGGDLYLGEGKDYGIETGLYEEEAMQAFKELTQFFTSYHLPVVADFSNRFRTGEMPIGVAPYSTYTQLQVFASEIKGLWSFGPIPGKVNEDGEINNTFVTATSQAMMMDVAKDKEAAWEFMKWWVDTETQLQYATTTEGIMGPAARYPSANVEVLRQLPWSRSEIEALETQFKATKGVPEVPGAYMTTRMVDYAFKNVVTDGQNPREALYLNAKTINEELTKKRNEFGLSTLENNE
ncbi:MAG: extracellular solute-binding protein [Clostridiales bacterium]|jgi:ABC-type glycerol-3-phosphate transport system substrate-binding protein|nr:extracellular solute-binding protein [Clostridiales bacterium]